MIHFDPNTCSYGLSWNFLQAKFFLVWKAQHKIADIITLKSTENIAQSKVWASDSNIGYNKPNPSKRSHAM